MKIFVLFMRALAMAEFYAKPASAAKSKLLDERRAGGIQE
jgi:hypothetical protein